MTLSLMEIELKLVHFVITINSEKNQWEETHLLGYLCIWFACASSSLGFKFIVDHVQVTLWLTHFHRVCSVGQMKGNMLGHSQSLLISLRNRHGFYLHFLDSARMRPFQCCLGLIDLGVTQLSSQRWHNYSYLCFSPPIWL